MNIKKALERTLHLETVKRTEEEEQTQRRAAIRRDETEILIDSVNRLDQQMSVGKENYDRSSDGRRDNSHWGGTRRDGNQNREQISTMWAKGLFGKELP